MNQKRRTGIFETNSSSSHSLSIATSGNLRDSLSVDDDGVCHIYPGEFGWGVEAFFGAETKASYCLTYSCDGSDPAEVTGEAAAELEMLRRVIQAKTGATSVVFEPANDDIYAWGYVDHQSGRSERQVCAEAYVSEETLLQFIFNPGSILYIDNDNH